MPTATPSVSVTDFSGLSKLRYKAQTDQSGALRQVAEQFEALFMQMMLKSVRDAKLGDGLFDSPQSDQYRDMLDSQMSMNLSEGRGLGLADVIVRQLGGEGESRVRPSSQSRGLVPPRVMETARAEKQTESATVKAPIKQPPFAVDPPSQAQLSVNQPSLVTDQSSPIVPAEPEADYTASPLEFVRKILPYAREAASLLGLGPEVLIAQSALETGWGQGVIRDHRGSSHNLFNIKADSRWQGPVVTKKTLEYIDGVAVLEKANFRRYDSPVESFKDYVAFLRSSPRYQEALNHQGDAGRFVEGLQDAGYATDPNYANKIKGILERPMLSDEQVRVKASDRQPISAERIEL